MLYARIFLVPHVAHIKNTPKWNVPTGDQPFCTSTREFFSYFIRFLTVKSVWSVCRCACFT